MGGWAAPLKLRMHSRNCGGAVRPVKQYLFPPAPFFFPSFLRKNAIATGDGRGTLIHARTDGKYRYFSDKYGYPTLRVYSRQYRAISRKISDEFAKCKLHDFFKICKHIPEIYQF